MSACPTATPVETYLGQIPVERLKTPSENELLYGRINPDDQDVAELAHSIRRQGILQPLEVSLDDYVLNGNRRLVAAKLAGLSTVPFTRYPITHNDPGFMPRLREHNRQRVKTFDQTWREALVDVNPEDAWDCVTGARDRAATVRLASNVTGTGRDTGRSRITDAKSSLMAGVHAVLEDMRDFLPVSCRRVHYGLVERVKAGHPVLLHDSKPTSHYRNDTKCYRATLDILVRMRLEGLIPWEWLTDETRPFTSWRTWPGPQEFVREQLDGFLCGYTRNLLRSQPNRIEILAEKLTVQSVVQDVARLYHISVTIGRGYASVDARNKMAERYRESGKDKLALILLTDFDPEGEDLARSFVGSMRDEFDVDVHPVKAALTHEQVLRLGLAPNFEAKASSTRYHSFVERYGRNVYELEAVPPAMLQQLLRDTIEGVIDMNLYNAEMAVAKEEARELAAKRTVALEYFRSAATEVTP